MGARLSQKMNKTLLLSEDEIAKKVVEAAHWINETYKGKELILVVVLKGAICFVSDLMRELTIPFQLEFVRGSSYGMKGTTPGALTLYGLDELDIANRHFLLVDDIYDTGVTLSQIYHTLVKKAPASLAILTLLRKKVPPKGDISPDYVCFDIEDHFVVGYGLDYKEHFRGEKAIYQLMP